MGAGLERRPGCFHWKSKTSSTKSKLILSEHRLKAKCLCSQLPMFVCSRQFYPEADLYHYCQMLNTETPFYETVVDIDLHLHNEKLVSCVNTPTLLDARVSWFHAAVLRVGSEGPWLGRAVGWSLKTLPGDLSRHNSFQNNTKVLVAFFTLILSWEYSGVFQSNLTQMTSPLWQWRECVHAWLCVSMYS